MPDLTPETLAELRRLLAEATPRPWIAEVSGTTGPVVMDAQSVSAFDHVAKCPHYRGSADSELIAAAVNALPGLLDAAAERDALAAKVERVRALADLIDRHTEYERDPVDFRDASHGGSWDDVADRIRRALDEEAQP